MNEVVVVARARAIAGKEEAVEAAFHEVIKPTHEEEGCHRYALHRGVDDRRTFVMIERWTSRDALNAHLQTPHVQTLFANLAGALERPAEILVLEPLSDTSGEKGRL